VNGNDFIRELTNENLDEEEDKDEEYALMSINKEMIYQR
jgi:hypothetical protein